MRIVLKEGNVYLMQHITTRNPKNVQLGFPPKYVPLEVVFIVILWQCSKNPQWQNAAVVGAVGSMVNAPRCPNLVGCGRLSTRRHCHSPPSGSVFKVQLCLPDESQRRHIANRRMTSLEIVILHSHIDDCDQISPGLSCQEQRMSFGFESAVEGFHLRVVFGSPQSIRQSQAVLQKQLGCLSITVPAGVQGFRCLLWQLPDIPEYRSTGTIFQMDQCIG
jgi:hypothetical protein